MQLYDDNPTLVGVAKTMDESKQGEVFFREAPQVAGPQEGRKFYIES